MNLLDGARIVFGSAFVLLLPGLAWSFVFFDKGRIDWIERTVLAFGLSIALVLLTVFWLNAFLRVQMTTLNAALAICTLTAAPLAYLAIRKRLGRKD